MATLKGENNSASESIGRPKAWRGTQEQKNRSGEEQSVIRKPGEGPNDTTSTTVTREDYEKPAKDGR